MGNRFKLSLVGMTNGARKRAADRIADRQVDLELRNSNHEPGSFAYSSSEDCFREFQVDAREKYQVGQPKKGTAIMKPVKAFILGLLLISTSAIADKKSAQAKAMDDASRAVAKEQKEFDKCNNGEGCAGFRKAMKESNKAIDKTAKAK